MTSEYTLLFGMCQYLYISLKTLNKMCAAMTMSTHRHCQVIFLFPVYRNECLYMCARGGSRRVLWVLKHPPELGEANYLLSLIYSLLEYFLNLLLFLADLL